MDIHKINLKLEKLRKEWVLASTAMKTYIEQQALLLKGLRSDLEKRAVKDLTKDNRLW